MSTTETLIGNPFEVLFNKLENIERMLAKSSHAESIEETDMADDERMDTTQLAKYLKCSRMTIQNYKRRGIITYYGTRKMTYFIKSEVDACLSSVAKKKKGNKA